MFREDFPRPNLIRPRWLSLDGDWNFYPNPSEDLNIETSSHTIISVPSSKVCEIGINSQVVLYKKTIILSEADVVGTVFFCCTGVSGDIELIVNGKSAGKKKGATLNVTIDISKYILSGDNNLLIYVIKDLLFAPNYQEIPFIYGNIWLEFASKSYFNNMVFRPSHSDKSIYVSSKVINYDKSQSVKAELFLEEQLVAQYNYDSALHLNIRIPFPEPVKYWNLLDGNLYEIKVSLYNSNGGLCDCIYSYSALRELSLLNGNLRINSKSVFLRHITDSSKQSRYFTNSKLIKQFILSIINLGFNGLNTPGFEPSPKFIYLADKLGLSLNISIVPEGLYPFTEDASKLIQACASSSVIRNLASPSIVLCTLYCNFDASAQFFDYINKSCKHLNPNVIISSISATSHYGNYRLNNLCFKSKSQILKDVHDLEFAPTTYFQSISIGPFEGAYSLNTQDLLLSEKEFVDKYEFISGALLSSKSIGFSYVSIVDTDTTNEGLYSSNLLPKLSRNSVLLIQKSNLRRSISELNDILPKT